MNILITKKESTLVIPETINFKELINNSLTLSPEAKSEMINFINSELNEQQRQIYIRNLYMCMNFNPTTDFPVNLDYVYKDMGFANKGNAMKTIKSNFTKDEDYKLILIPREKKQNAGRSEHEIMLNIDTYKTLCMLVKTPQGKEIRKYYVKLENIYNSIVKKEFDNTKVLLEENKQLLLKQQEHIEQLENKPELEGFIRKPGYIYLIKDITKLGHYKIGFADKPDKRLTQLNCGSSTFALQLVSRFKTFDKIYAEKIIHYALFPFKILKANEWFYIKNDFELAYTINIIKDCINYIEKYNIKDLVSFNEINRCLNIQKELLEINNEINLQEQTEIDRKELQNITCTQQGQQMKNKTGNYKGIHWNEDKKKWTACLKKDYINIFLGHYSSEEEGAKAYNDYALFLNNNEKTSYLLNTIPNYTSIPRDIPNENKESAFTSKYKGINFDKKRKCFTAYIRCNNKAYYLGYNEIEIEAAKLYNQQALYFNETLKTDYKLNDIPYYITISKDVYKDVQNNKKKKSSEYVGVCYENTNKIYKSYIINNKKTINIGNFKTELEAVIAYNNKAEELNKENKDTPLYKLHKINDIKE